MRLPQRVVVDHDVDRREVQGPRGSQPTRTNSPKSSVWREVESCCDLSSDIRGGFSRGVPPLPIPNRAVKPARADGTDTPVGRVGRRRTSGSPDVIRRRGSFLCVRGARLGRARRDAVRLTSGTHTPPVRRLSEVNCYIDCRLSSPDWMYENNVPYDFTIVKAPGLEWPRGFLLIIDA